MGMTDCEKCWDTPCSCGHAGYIVLYLPKDHGLSYEEVLELKRDLKPDLMDRLAAIKGKRK